MIILWRGSLRRVFSLRCGTCLDEECNECIETEESSPMMIITTMTVMMMKIRNSNNNSDYMCA
jgi:hypothetical protein